MVLIFYGVVQLIVASNNGDIEAGFFTEFVVAVTLAFINAVMPFVFKAMIAFECVARRAWPTVLPSLLWDTFECARSAILSSAQSTILRGAHSLRQPAMLSVGLLRDYNGRDEEIRVEISRTFLLRMLTILALLQGYALETKLLDTQVVSPPGPRGCGLFEVVR